MRVPRLAVATFVLLGAAWAVAGVLAPPALEPHPSAPTVATPAPTLATPAVAAAEPSPSAPPAVAPVARAAPIQSVLPRIDVASNQAPVLVPHTWELIVGGEIIYGRGVQERVEKYGDPARPFAKVRDLLRRADLAIATLEAPLSGDNNRYCDTSMTFVGNESYVSGLVSSGIRAVSLAANHIGDAGPAGVTDSIRVLGAAGIVAFGAGANEEAARTPAVLTTPGGGSRSSRTPTFHRRHIARRPRVRATPRSSTTRRATTRSARTSPRRDASPTSSSSSRTGAWSTRTSRGRGS